MAPSTPKACTPVSVFPSTPHLHPQGIAYNQVLCAERLHTGATNILPVTSPSQDFYEPGLEPAATTKLDDLQRSWETLKNVVSVSNPALVQPYRH